MRIGPSLLFVLALSASAGAEAAEGRLLDLFRWQLERDEARFAELARLERYVPKARYKCILENMEGVMNDRVAESTYIMCEERHPRSETLQNQKETGFFSSMTPAACMRKYGARTVSRSAATYIDAACDRLYGP